jgi:hypothetical protein
MLPEIGNGIIAGKLKNKTANVFPLRQMWFSPGR